MKLGLKILLVFFCFILVLGALPDFDSDSEDGNEYANEGYAYSIAQDKVREVLKAPATADFADYGEYSIRRNGDTFYIDSYVDAENSFGAKLRKNFSVTVVFEGEHYSATLTSFE